MKNKITLTAKMLTDIETAYTYEHAGEIFYIVKIETQRLSGASDILPVIIPKSLVEDTKYLYGDYVRIIGSIRTRNVKDNEGKNHTEIRVFANYISYLPSDLFQKLGYENECFLTGVICKEPSFRKTNKGRKITDLCMAIQRNQKQKLKSDYLPLIAWGEEAEITKHLSVGDTLSIIGRFQSRDYTKNSPFGLLFLTTYEVSVRSLLKISPEEEKKRGD